MAGVHPLLAWPLVAGGLVITFIISTALYNIFFHPLRAVPGPKLWAASRLPFTLVWISGRAPAVILALHERYGDVVRVGPNRLSFTDPDAFRDVRGHRRLNQGEHGKDSQTYRLHTSHIGGASREDHSRFRRVLAHGFSAKSMQDQQPLITQYIDLLMERLHSLTHDADNKPSPAVVDMAAYANFTTFDIIGDLAFGEPFHCLAESRFHPWVDAILRSVASQRWLFPILWHVPQLLDLAKKSEYIRAGWEASTNFAAEQVKKRIDLGTSRPDFLESMMVEKTKDGKLPLTQKEMASNAMLIVLAGSETTATVLTGTVFFLSKHPEVQKRLAEEVRSSYASEDEIDLFSVSKLKYMLAVLDESMRMFPPVMSPLPRECKPGGDVICGYQVPENTVLDIFPWAMNYCTRNFTAPGKFVPERWLDEEVQDLHLEKARHHAMQPFSVGPRNCIGRCLAYVEMRLIMARIIWNYDLTLADEVSERLLESKTFSLWPKVPLNVRLTPVGRD